MSAATAPVASRTAICRSASSAAWAARRTSVVGGAAAGEPGEQRVARGRGGCGPAPRRRRPPAGRSAPPGRRRGCRRRRRCRARRSRGPAPGRRRSLRLGRPAQLADARRPGARAWRSPARSAARSGSALGERVAAEHDRGAGRQRREQPGDRSGLGGHLRVDQHPVVRADARAGRPARRPASTRPPRVSSQPAHAAAPAPRGRAARTARTGRRPCAPRGRSRGPGRRTRPCPAPRGCRDSPSSSASPVASSRAASRSCGGQDDVHAVEPAVVLGGGVQHGRTAAPDAEQHRRGLPVHRQGDGDGAARADVELVLEQVGRLGHPVVQRRRRRAPRARRWSRRSGSAAAGPGRGPGRRRAGRPGRSEAWPQDRRSPGRWRRESRAPAPVSGWLLVGGSPSARAFCAATGS